MLGGLGLGVQGLGTGSWPEVGACGFGAGLGHGAQALGLWAQGQAWASGLRIMALRLGRVAQGSALWVLGLGPGARAWAEAWGSGLSLLAWAQGIALWAQGREAAVMSNKPLALCIMPDLKGPCLLQDVHWNCYKLLARASAALLHT